MADYDGCLHDGTVSAFSNAARAGRAGWVHWMPDGPPPPIQYYRMRAWNLTTVDWEVWTSTGAPDVTPPSGNPVTGITVVGIWEA